MGVALLLITHDDIGRSLLATAVNMIGESPIACENLVITQNMDIEQGFIQAIKLCRKLDNSDGILIATDIYGSTPSNIATKLVESAPGQARLIITGLNLPMLVRIMNYAYLNLHDLASKACSSASDSIFIVENMDCD